MQLLDWMKRENYTYRRLQDETGIDHTLLFKYAKGERKPKLKNIVILAKITNGQVSVEDFFPEVNDIPKEEEEIEI